MSTKKKSVASLKIGKNERAEKIFKSEMTAKIVSFQTIEEFAKDLDLTIDKEELYKEPKESIIKAFDLSTKEGVLRRLSIEKKIDLFEFNIERLDALVNNFKSIDRTFDPVTYDYKTPSFDIILKGEETIKKYQSADNLIKAIRDLEEFVNVKPMDVVRMSGGAITFNPSNGELKPSIITK